MNVPWRYILGLASGFILALSVFIIFLYTQLGVPTHMSQWIFDVVDKKEQFAAKISGPRLFIVAGSNALFGINAQLIEQQTGCPTINMGTAAGLNLDYRLYRIEKIARPGDTILLACEYELYKSGFGFETLDDFVLARDPGYFHQMPLLDKIYMATRIPFKRFQRGWRNRVSVEYVRPPAPPYSPYTPLSTGINSLDENGDEMFNFPEMRPPASHLALTGLNPILMNGLPSENTKGFEVLTAFLQWAQAHHITVLATFPNIVYQPAYDGPNGKKAIETISHFYASHGVPVIGTAKEAMLPIEQFFDTIYHPTHEEALERTKRLIPELRPYLHLK
jgi:hypothetical protein